MENIIKLTEQQEKVLKELKRFMTGDYSVFILCGYAGTGKTTIIKHMYEYITGCGHSAFSIDGNTNSGNKTNVLPPDLYI